MGAFLRQQASAALHTNWQLLQVAPVPDRPGVFILWALVETPQVTTTRPHPPALLPPDG